MHTAIFALGQDIARHFQPIIRILSINTFLCEVQLKVKFRSKSDSGEHLGVQNPSWHAPKGSVCMQEAGSVGYDGMFGLGTAGSGIVRIQQQTDANLSSSAIAPT
jgi:hypothetical protein